MKSLVPLRNFLQALLFLVLVASCRREDPFPYPIGGGPGVDEVAVDSTEVYNIQYQFSEDVIRFGDERSLQYILEVHDDESVVLDAGLPTELRPVVGSILSADVSDRTPYGLGNRVLSVDEVDGTLVCETEVAALDEVFSVLELTSRIPLLNLEGNTLVDSEGNEYKMGRATISEDGELVPETKVSIGSPELICINLPGKTNNFFYVTGQIAFGAVLVVDISLSKLKFEISLEPSFGINAQLGFQYEKTLDEVWADAFRKDLFPKSNLVNGVIQVGPVTLRPYVDIYCYANIKAKGEVQFKFSKASSAKFGWTEEGAFKESKTSESDKNGFVKEINIDGKFAFEPEAEFDLGMGLWTKKLAAEMVPSVSIELAAGLDLSNVNLWRLNPYLSLNIGGEAKGRVLVDLFKVLRLTREMTFLEWSIIDWKWPLLPQYQKESMSISLRENQTPIVFDASYAMTGGLLSRFGILHPSLRIYRGGNLVYTKDDDTNIKVNETYSPSFVLSDLEQDVSYTAKPSIRFRDKYFDIDGYSFSSTSPTAAITDIVQTGSAKGSFYHVGRYYTYEFYFYVNSYIKGSENCKEWGIYDPESVDIHYPNELKDGRVTQYWTGWSNQSAASWTKTAYVYLKDGKEKRFEPHTHTCTYGGGGPVVETHLPFVPNNAEPMTCRLDSIVIDGRTIIPETPVFSTVDRF